MPNVRIATFNCENLFSRPKIFELKSEKKSRDLLNAVADLEQELRQEVFDKPKIIQLEKKLKGFATVNDVRGNHLAKNIKGANEWLGWVELVRQDVSEVAQLNTARVIAEIDADLICLMEIENRPELQKFHDHLVFTKFQKPAGKAGYENIIVVDGNDDRGIDVAIMCRLPVLWLRTHIQERTQYLGNMVSTFSRDCLEVRIQLPGKEELYMLINHFKSKRSGKNDPQSNIRREGQAKRVAELVKEHDLTKENVIVAGDLNDDANSAPLNSLLGITELFNCNQQLPEDDRGTFRTGKQQFDYLLISDPLKARLKEVHVERRGIFSTKFPHFPTVDSRKAEASDHGAVVAEFQF